MARWAKNGGWALTVIGTDAVLPSTETRIVVVPAATAVTRPSAVIVAIELFAEVHRAVRSVSRRPAAGR